MSVGQEFHQCLICTVVSWASVHVAHFKGSASYKCISLVSAHAGQNRELYVMYKRPWALTRDTMVMANKVIIVVCQCNVSSSTRSHVMVVQPLSTALISFLYSHKPQLTTNLMALSV